MRRLIGFVAALSLGAIAAAEAQTEPRLTATQSLIYRLQYKIWRDRVERDGVAALFLLQGLALAIAEFDDISETSRCTVEFKLAPFEGSCRIHTCQQTTLSPVSAGMVTIVGPGRTFVLTPNPDNTYDPGFGDPVSWMGGEALGISATGAPSGFHAFRHNLHVPTDATLTSPLLTQGVTINRSQPLDFTWDPVRRPSQAKSTFTVVAGTLDGSQNMQCDYPLTKHKRGRIFATILSVLPAGPALLGFDVRQERAEFLNRARDFVLTAVVNLAETPSGDLASLDVELQ